LKYIALPAQPIPFHPIQAQHVCECTIRVRVRDRVRVRLYAGLLRHTGGMLNAWQKMSNVPNSIYGTQL